MPSVNKPVPAMDRYDNGKIRYRGQNLDGHMHGAWKFFRRDGSLMRSGSFDRGRQTGVWRTYDRSGAVTKETKFSKSGESRSGAGLSRAPLSARRGSARAPRRGRRA